MAGKLDQEDLQVMIEKAVQEAVSSAFDAERKIEIQTVAEIVADCYKALMNQEEKEIFRIHGRLLQVSAMIEELSARDELDISMLADEANKRAYALAVMMAERAVEGAEDSLSVIQGYIEEASQMVAFSQEGHSAWYKGPKCGGSFSRQEWKNRLNELLKQERTAKERVRIEHERLTSLRLKTTQQQQ